MLYLRKEGSCLFLCFVQGIINSFPSMKSLYSKKRGRARPYKDKVFAVNHSQFVNSLSPHTAGHWSHSSLHSPHLSSLQSMHEELELHIPGQDVGPSQVTNENLAFPSMPDGMDTAQHRPCFGEDTGQGVTVPLCWAPVLGITCTWGMRGTQRDKLKEKGELNKAQFPEIWAEKAVSHWRELPPECSS